MGFRGFSTSGRVPPAAFPKWCRVSGQFTDWQLLCTIYGSAMQPNRFYKTKERYVHIIDSLLLLFPSITIIEALHFYSLVALLVLDK
jgi:hypothetical protein